MSTRKKARPKRLFSLLLALVMLLGALPLSALPVSAAEAEQSNATSMLAATNGLNEDLPTWNTTPTWELIKSVFFQDTRLKLLRDWLGSDTDSTRERYIRLEADIEVSVDYLKDAEKIVVNGKKVLDLNGHKISIKLGKGAGYSGRKIAITVNSGATLMVIDSRGGGKIFGDSWICAPEDLGYERASTDLFYNKGTLIINVPDGEIETGRSKKQWVTAASEDGVKESIAYARYSGYIRGQSNGAAIIGSEDSTTVIVSGRVIGRGFYKFGESPWGTSTDTPYVRCSAVRTDGTFIMYGGEIYGMGGANTLSTSYKSDVVIYSGYFRTTTIDRMAIQADKQEDLTSAHANFTKRCEYGSIGVKGIATDAEYFNGKHDATVRPKSVTDMTSDSIVLSHNYGVNIIDPKTQDTWVVYANYKPYFSLTARNYIGNGGYTGEPYGYDYKLSTTWKARAEFTILDSNGDEIGYYDAPNWLKDEADKSTFRCDVLACKPTRGQSIIWMSAHTYTLRCKITESWGGDPAQTRTVYQDLAFSIWDQDTLQAAKSMDFEFTPTSTAKGDPTNFIVSLKDSCLTAASDNFITKMDIRYSYYEPITNNKGEVTRFEKKTETAETDADIIVESRDIYNRRVWSIGRDTVLRPKAAGPIEVAIDIYTSNGPLVDTKTYKIFAMPALTGRFLSSEEYAVPADGYTMEARYTAWKAYMDSGLGKFANMSDYGITPASVIWQYYDLETNKFVDIARGDSRFVFEGDTIFATNRTGEYRASYEFQGVRYYSPRTIFVIAQSYDTTYEPYITGPGYAEYGENEPIKVKLNNDADWSGVSEYTLICRRYPQGAGLRVSQSTNTTGEFTLEEDFFRNSMTKEKFVPGDYIFEAKVRHANGVATSVRFIIPYGVTSSGFTFSVDDKKADRLDTGDGKYVMLSGDDSIFKVNYALYPANSTEEQYPADEYDYAYVNLTKDIISLADDGVASILAPGDAKIQLKIVKKSTGATVASPTLTVTIPVVGFEVEEPNYSDCIGQNWSDMKATIKSVWGPGGRKVTTDTDKYMTVSLKASGMGFGHNKVAYNDKGDITWTARTEPGYQFAMEIVSADTLNGKTCIICRADVSTIETNAFTDTVKTAREHGLYSAIHGEYTYYPGEDYCDPTSATFEMTSRNIHVKDPNMQYIDVVSITTSTPAVGDPRYEGTDSNRYYSEYMTVELGSLSDLLCADGSPMVRAETKVSKLGAITGSGKPYDNAQDDSSTEYTSVFNFSDGVANPPTKKYEAGIYENWLRLDIIGQDASGKKYGFAPDVKLFVNGHLIEFAGVYYNAPPTNSRLDVFYYFDVGAVTQYNEATVDATDITPTVGMKPKGADGVSVEGTNDIEVTKLLWFVDANGNGKCDSGEEASIENGHLAADGTFMANKQYSMDLEVGVADGAEGRLTQPFTLKVKYDDSLATERKTKEQTVSSVDPNGVFTFPYTYITSVDERVNKPENGVYTKSAALLTPQSAEEAQKKGYTIHSFEWKNLDGTQVEEEELIPGKKYRHEVTLVHNCDESRFAPPLTVVKIDGQTLKAEESATESWFEAASNTLTIHYIFTVPDPAATGYTVSGSVTSFGNETDDVTIRLIAEGTSEAAYEVVVQGNAASYSIDNVVPGTYTMKVMKVKHVTKEYTVTVEGSNVTQDVKIHLLGDVTGDGAIDTADAVLVLQRAAGLIGDDSLEATAADVNGDKAIDTADAVLILQKSAELIDKFPAEA